MAFRVSFLVLLVGISWAFSQNQSEAESSGELDPQAQAAIEVYSNKAEKAKEKLLTSMKKTRAGIQNGKGRAEAKLTLLEEFDNAQQQFEVDGTLPTLTSLVIAVNEYEASLANERLKCEKEIDRAVTRLVNEDGEGAKALIALKGRLFAKNDENSKRRFNARLEGTRWVWPDNNLRPKNWFVLQPSGVLTAGWHDKPGDWKVLSPTKIEAVIAASNRQPVVLTIDAKFQQFSGPNGLIFKRLQ